MSIQIHLPVPREQAAGAGTPDRLLCEVDEHGSVLAWDPIAGAYTRCHGLSPEQEAEARRLAAVGGVEAIARRVGL